ncbi:MAG: amine oxidase [Rhodospirillales bacterium]|nr:amine oxidase [Rhodospirillales bacterium]
MSAEFDVLIIGGGAAGIGAARRLARSGIPVLLLEASARLGGRAWTCEIAGYPLDLGCGWLHSGDRNSWTAIADASGIVLDRREPAWGIQYRDLGFPPAEQNAAKQALAVWRERLSVTPPASDCAADAVAAGSEWNAYLQALSGFISGAELERISATDYIAYDKASTPCNWRAPSGYGALIASSLPLNLAFRPSSPVESVEFAPCGVKVATATGTVQARAAILTVSTAVLAGSTIKLPRALDPWRDAARLLPLGRNEKLYLEIVGGSPFEPETQVLGNPRDAASGAYYIRPFGRPVIECFFGGEGARLVEKRGPVVGFAYAIDQLAALFGSDVRQNLRPLIASSWSRMVRIGGAYSYAVPGHAAARQELARPFEDRLFFAGEATHHYDFSTAHGAYDSGVRAADEAIAALGLPPQARNET